MNNPSYRALSILFVDDEPQARKYFSMGLADSFSIVTAETADEAESILARDSEQFAVLITDQMMPGRTGSSLLSSVRSAHPGIVRILTTAFSDIQGAIEAVNKGEVFRYITKPWDFDSLRQEMRIAVQVYELQRDRDALLAEKISVKLRLKAAERARLLVGLSGALPSLPRFHEAVGAYIGDMAALNFSPTPGLARDLSADAEVEADLARAIGAEFVEFALAATGSEPSPAPRAVDSKHGAGSMRSAMHTNVADLKAARLARYLADGLSSITSQEPSIRVDSDAQVIRLTAEGLKRSDAHDPILFGDIEAESVGAKLAMLKAYVLAYALNGTMETTVEGDRVRTTIAVPLGSAGAELASTQAGAVINRRIFQSLENWL